MFEHEALTYDDITLVPAYSDIASRMDVNLRTQLSRNYTIVCPIVASPMDTVCESDMAIALMELGGVGCIHRFMSIEEQVRQVRQVYMAVRDFGDLGTTPVMAAVGANGDYFERAVELVKAGANVILIDVAHGHHKFVRDAIVKLKEHFPEDRKIDIIAGNVATRKAAEDLEAWGADAIRSGVGGGSLCTTRIQTGFGVPNVTSIVECSTGVSIPVIADGGIRNSGDIAKALAVGASSVMLGSLLAGTKEAPGTIIDKNGSLYKRYRGAASMETKSQHGQAARNVEGESTIISFKGGVSYVVNNLMDGLRSALSYAGAASLDEYCPEIAQVTHAGTLEAKPHLL